MSQTGCFFFLPNSSDNETEQFCIYLFMKKRKTSIRCSREFILSIAIKMGRGTAFSDLRCRCKERDSRAEDLPIEIYWLIVLHKGFLILASQHALQLVDNGRSDAYCHPEEICIIFLSFFS